MQCGPGACCAAVAIDVSAYSLSGQPARAAARPHDRSLVGLTVRPLDKPPRA
jgi:hypothetical protein